MFAIALFLAVLISSLFAGATLAYPVYVLLSLVNEVDFADVIILSTQLAGLAGSLLYLKYSDSLGFENLGYMAPRGGLKRNCFIFFTCGLIIVLLLGASLYALGIYDIHSQRDMVLAAVPRLVISAIGTGMLVAIFEETVFRGALLHGLQKQSSAPIAIIMTSLVYAWVHFIHFDSPVDPEMINFFFAPANFFSAYTDFLFLNKMDAFISLFMLGMLLGMMRIKQGNLISCIALHAGLVAGIKVFRYLLEYQPENPYKFLVSSHDYRLGFLASLWIFIAALMFYFFSYRKMGHEA